ncbi:hypothetical protein LTR50_005780 [Elasticomyces elasticus]|nr:hypothetical protein LTR50_005780 [Elasticomyces elasticus]
MPSPLETRTQLEYAEGSQIARTIAFSDGLLRREHPTSDAPRRHSDPHPSPPRSPYQSLRGGLQPKNTGDTLIQTNYFNIAVNQGDDCAGIVDAVGSDVRNFNPGDRVAGFHVMAAEHGTYTEYAICPENTVFHLPEHVSDEEGATIPLAAFTVAVGSYRNLRLPRPFARSDGLNFRTPKVPLVVNGVGFCGRRFCDKSSPGSIQIPALLSALLADRRNLQRCVGADVVVDYKSKSVVEDLKTALGGAKCYQVFDAANTPASTEYLTAVLEKNGALTYTQRASPEDVALLDEAEIWHEQIWVGNVHETKLAGGKRFGVVMSRVFEMALTEKKLSGQPYQVVPNGLDGVRGALYLLRDRKGGNANFVYRITATPGL